MKGDFNEVRTRKNAKVVNLNGNLEFSSPEHLVMNYTNADEFFSIEGNKMVIKHGKQNQNFDTKKNAPMRSLSHALIYAFTGKLTELSQEQNTTLEVAKVGNEYVATLKAKKKAARGYSLMKIGYKVSNGRICSMRLDEFNGASTTYTLK